MSKSRAGWADAAPYQKQQMPAPRWEDLSLSANMALRAIQYGSMMGTLVLKLPPEQFNVLKTNDIFVKEMSLYKRDFDAFHIELKTLIAEHSDKKGIIKNGDDNMTYLMLGERYVNWTERFEVVMMPVIANLQLRITSLLNPAELDKVKDYLIDPQQVKQDIQPQPSTI